MLRTNPKRSGPTLGGSWVVIGGVTRRVAIVITHIKGLITPLITTHEPPNMKAATGRASPCQPDRF